MRSHTNLWYYFLYWRTLRLKKNMRLNFTDISLKLFRHRKEIKLSCVAPTCLRAVTNISSCAVNLLQNNILFWVTVFLVFCLWHFVGFLVIVCVVSFLPLPPFPIASEFSVLTLHRNGRQCRVTVPGGHWDCFRSWFQNQSKKSLGFTLEKKVQKITVKCM